MSKFVNIVKIKIKSGSKKNYIKKIENKENFDGLISSKHLTLDSNTYCMIEEWRSKEALIKARKTIEISDKLKPLIKDQSSIVEITSLINGPVIIEEYEKEKEIMDFGTSSLDVKKKKPKTSQLLQFFEIFYENSLIHISIFYTIILENLNSAFVVSVIRLFCRMMNHSRMERAKGLEPSTFSLATRRSTN